MAIVTKRLKSPVGQKLNESFEDKTERRLQFHEILRRRHNLTSCRQDNPNWRKGQEKHSPREQEFLKRRHLWSDETMIIEKRVKSSPELKRNIGESTMKKGSEVSWYHYQSNNYPPFHFLNDILSLGPSYARRTRNDVVTTEKGVQTIQETLVISAKKDSSQQTDCGVSVLNCELEQLSEYLGEALQREQKLKNKLSILQELLGVLVHTSETFWKAQLNEDNLKSKVATLENQLFLCSQNISKTSIKKILLEMEENKRKYHEKTKESLQKLTDKKIATETRLKNTQMSLVVSTDDCKLWKEEYEKLKGDWTELSIKHCEMKNEMNVMQSKLQWVTNQDAQLQQLQNHLQILQQERIDLEACKEQLHESCEIQKEQLISMQARLRNAEEQKLCMQKQLKALQYELAALEQKCQSNMNALQHHDHIQLIVEKLTLKEDECAGLKAEVELITEEYKSCQRKLQQCREELKKIHKRKPKLQCCWLPVFLMIFAVIAAFIFSI